MKPVGVPARSPALLHSPATTTMFKRETAMVPFELPRLSDKVAAQLIELLHQIVQGIEPHYAEQAHRYRKRQQDIAYSRQAPASNPTDPPF